jgi:hypothetical protein
MNFPICAVENKDAVISHLHISYFKSKMSVKENVCSEGVTKLYMKIWYLWSQNYIYFDYKFKVLKYIHLKKRKTLSLEDPNLGKLETF